MAIKNNLKNNACVSPGGKAGRMSLIITKIFMGDGSYIAGPSSLRLKCPTLLHRLNNLIMIDKVLSFMKFCLKNSNFPNNPKL